jgi:hypothetical protein
MAFTQPLIAECDTCGLPFLGGEVSPDGSLVLGIGAVYEGSGKSMRTKVGSVHIGSQTAWSGTTLNCPRPGCPGWGQIPDGFVDWFRGAITLVRNTPHDELTSLADDFALQPLDALDTALAPRRRLDDHPNADAEDIPTPTLKTPTCSHATGETMVPSPWRATQPRSDAILGSLKVPAAVAVMTT